MNYTDPTYVPVDGFRIATYPQGPEDGVPIILIHGWPELAYSWSTTVDALTAAGYRAIPYDLLGFGRSDAPREIEHYGIENLVAHLQAVLDYYDIEKALMLGHDWGGIVLWNGVRMLEHRTKAAISISTPHVGRAPIDPMKIFEKRFGKDHYFLQFRDETERVETLFNANTDAFFRMMFRTSPNGIKLTPELTHLPKRFDAYVKAGAPDNGEMVITPEQRAVYTELYERTGFLPGMNYYRNTTRNWALVDGLPVHVRVPSLMISPEDDFFLPPSSTDPMLGTVADLKRVTIPNCGHWAMWDEPEAVNTAILNWLDARGF